MKTVQATRPHTTLFMLMSFDGKISTGAGEERDIDTDFAYIAALKEGRYQYDELEQQTDLCSFNTGRVMAKVGWNEPKERIEPIPVTFVVLDNQPHLTELGVRNLCKRTKKLYLVTANSSHPAHGITDLKNLEIIKFESLPAIFERLGKEGVARITIQSGGTMNAELLRQGIIDEISVVVAPIIIGGKNTPTLADGNDISSVEELSQIVQLRLISAQPLEHSFLHIRYEVVSA